MKKMTYSGTTRQENRHGRGRGAGLRALAAALVLLVGGMCTQQGWSQVAGYGEKQMGEPAEDHLPTVLNKVGVEQKLNTRLPLAANFKDENGAPVTLGSYFGSRPAILALVYYQCPMLCSEELRGLTGALEMVSLKPGKDFDIVVISIDPTESPELAHAKKVEYLKYYGHPDTASGWHFLTGPESSIKAVTNATGFGYVRVPGPDGKMNQFAHASAIQIVTPDGRIAQYYMGVEYSPKDIRLGLVEASEHRIGTPVDSILTYCYHYDPRLNRHSLVIARVVQLGGLFTVLILGGYMVLMFRRDLKQQAVVASREERGVHRV